MGSKRRRGAFITLEGPDGCGKSTQAARLVAALKKRGRAVLHTREPGGTPLAESVRGIILHSNHAVSPLAELLLYEASRAQHTEEVILPALRQGKIVVSERYADATLAYQGYGRRMDLNMVRSLNRIATGGLEPDLTILLDLRPELGLRRTEKARAKDRLEKETLPFHRRVRRGYLALARREPRRFRVISAEGPISAVSREVRGSVEEFLVQHGKTGDFLLPCGLEWRAELKV